MLFQGFMFESLQILIVSFFFSFAFFYRTKQMKLVQPYTDEHFGKARSPKMIVQNNRKINAIKINFLFSLQFIPVVETPWPALSMRNQGP